MGLSVIGFDRVFVFRVGLCVQFSFSKTHDKSSALASFLMARESPKEVEGRNTGG